MWDICTKIINTCTFMGARDDNHICWMVIETTLITCYLLTYIDKSINVAASVPASLHVLFIALISLLCCTFITIIFFFNFNHTIQLFVLFWWELSKHCVPNTKLEQNTSSNTLFRVGSSLCRLESSHHVPLQTVLFFIFYFFTFLNSKNNGHGYFHLPNLISWFVYQNHVWYVDYLNPYLPNEMVPAFQNENCITSKRLLLLCL